MRLIAELQGMPENDNGRATLPTGASAGSPRREDASAEVLQSSAFNDGGRNGPAAVHTLMVFLPDEDDSECAAEIAEGGGIALLPILRAANDDVTPADADALLAADGEFDAVCDERRERWMASMDAEAANDALASGEPDEERYDTCAGAEPRAEGAEDDDCA